MQHLLRLPQQQQQQRRKILSSSSQLSSWQRWESICNINMMLMRFLPSSNHRCYYCCMSNPSKVHSIRHSDHLVSAEALTAVTAFGSARSVPRSSSSLLLLLRLYSSLSTRNTMTSAIQDVRQQLRRCYSTSQHYQYPSDDDVAAPSVTATTTATLSSSSSSSSPPRGRGLFSLSELQQPTDFVTAATLAMNEGNRLRQELQHQVHVLEQQQQSTQHHHYYHTALMVLHLLDDISKTVCNVIDAAELCRHVHASRQWRSSAEKAFSILTDYINELNADTDLYHAVSCVVNIMKQQQPFLFTEEQVRFATLLQAEFERDGIHLPDGPRQHVRQLRNHVSQIETLFTTNIIHAQKLFPVHATAVNKVIPIGILQQAIPQQQPSSSDDDDIMTLSTTPVITNTLLKHSDNAQLRKDVYMASNTTCPENLAVLDALIQLRHEMSVAMGFTCYADRFLRDKMARQQSTVYQFLHDLQQHVTPYYQADMMELLQVKKEMEPQNSNNTIVEPWDVQYYVHVIKSREGLDANDGSAHFTVPKCLDGMKVLVDRLFNIAMEEQDDMTREERWDLGDDDNDQSLGGSSDATTAPPPQQHRIRKFIFTERSTGRSLGTMYLDLFPRPGKFSHAAHFTVRCGCVLDAMSSFSLSSSSTEQQQQQQTTYQLPIIALVCNLTQPLSHGEVEMLFHEFGHALHSLLSRTSFQHLAGTRTAMDLVETPSHFMEQYAWDASFLSKTLLLLSGQGGKGNDDVVQSIVKGRYRFRSLEIQQQLVYAMFDQQIFGPPNLSSSSTTSTSSADRIQQTTNLFGQLHHQCHMPHADGTYWHARFGHLVTYGAGYYSYLYAQVFANDIWDYFLNQMNNNKNNDSNNKEEEDDDAAWQRRVGMQLWNKLLIHGGAKDPQEMLQDLLGRSPKVDSFLSRMHATTTKNDVSTNEI